MSDAHKIDDYAGYDYFNTGLTGGGSMCDAG